MRIVESIGLSGVRVLDQDPEAPIMEAKVADVPLAKVRAVYPMIRAIHSNKLTRNFTFYPPESLKGRDKRTSPTGYASFVKPYPKPVLREHRASDGMFTQADEPIGRIIYAGYLKRDVETLIPAPNGYPGFAEGDGYVCLVASILGEQNIERVVGGVYHTVSIGCEVGKVIESISGEDLIELRRAGKEMPPYERGNVYDGKLSYWTMGPIYAQEVSFVNVPSDTNAAVENPDIGEHGVQLLVAQKKVGAKEFEFLDARTGELVFEHVPAGGSAWARAESLELVDSFNLGKPTFSFSGLELKKPEDPTVDKLVRRFESLKRIGEAIRSEL